MGQTAAKEAVENIKEAVLEIKDIIAELKDDVTLKRVIYLNDELGHGAYGSVFKVKYGKVVCKAKRSPYSI